MSAISSSLRLFRFVEPRLFIAFLLLVGPALGLLYVALA